MAKKLLLINPDPAEHSIFAEHLQFLNLPPLNLGYIAALTPSNWEIQILDERLGKYQDEEADLVGLTAFTTSAPRAYELASYFKDRGIPTIMGGIHASMVPDEAAKYVDSVFIGEAELTWKEVIQDFEKKQLQPKYQGKKSSLENLVLPRRDLFSKNYHVQGIQTARGCPMECDFCSVTTFNGGRYRQRPVNEVLDELETLNSKLVLFLDDNILGHGQQAEQRAIQLFKGIIERGLPIKWGGQASVNFTDNEEVLKYAQKSGCFSLIVGFESISEDALKKMHKVENLKQGVVAYKERIKRFHDHGISVMGAFIFGNDGEDKDIFRKTWEFVLEAQIDCCQYAILVPYPGTKLYKRLKAENRLLYTNYPHDWVCYDMIEHVTFQPEKMTPDDILEGVLEAMKATNSLSTSLKRAFQTLIKTKNIYGAGFAYIWNRALYKVSFHTDLYGSAQSENE